MNNPKLYTVKEAAKIVGVSTNTLYKYLDEDRIHAARGSAIQGRFRIPESALEEFLGVKLSEQTDQLTNRITESPISPTVETQTLEDKIETTDSAPQLDPKSSTSTRSHLPLKIARFLLVLALIAILIDLFISGSVSPVSQLTRLFFVAVMILLSYQEGGFRRS